MLNDSNTTTVTQNSSNLHGPPNSLQFHSSFLSNFSNFSTEEFQGNHLDQLYKFLRETEWNTSVLPSTIFISILMAVGTVGNGLVIAVFLHTSSLSRMGGSSSDLLVMFLAMADLLVCLVAMPGQIVRAWYLPWHHDGLCKTWELLRHAALPISVVIQVAIAHDRYRMICQPTSQLSVSQLRRRFKVIVLLACMMGLGFGIPAMLSVGVNQKMANGSGEYYLGLCEVNGLIISQASMKIYWHVLVCFFILVLLLLLISYSAILLSVWKHANFRNRRITTHQAPNHLSSTCTFKAWKPVFWNRHSKVGILANLDKQPNHQSGTAKTPDKFKKANSYPVKADNSIVTLNSENSFTVSTSQKDSASKCCNHKSRKQETKIFSVTDVKQSKSCFTGMQEPAACDNCIITNQRQDDLFLTTTGGAQSEPPVPPPTRKKSGKGTKRKKVKRKKSADSGVDSVSQSSCSATFSQEGPQPLLHLPQRLRQLAGKHLLTLPMPEHQRYPHLHPGPSHHHHQLMPHSTSIQQTTHPELKTSSSNSSDKASKTTSHRTEAFTPARRPPYRAHVKTAAMFFLVTMTFLVSYLPTFLMIVKLVPTHPVLFYTYLIHAAATPLLYSLANKKFRTSARQLFHCSH